MTRRRRRKGWRLTRPWDSCGKKRRYGSWDEAGEACLEIWANPANADYNERHANPPQPYPCPLCGAYHVGHLRWWDMAIPAWRRRPARDPARP